MVSRSLGWPVASLIALLCSKHLLLNITNLHWSPGEKTDADNKVFCFADMTYAVSPNPPTNSSCQGPGRLHTRSIGEGQQQVWRKVSCIWTSMHLPLKPSSTSLFFNNLARVWCLGQRAKVRHAVSFPWSWDEYVCSISPNHWELENRNREWMTTRPSPCWHWSS